MQRQQHLARSVKIYLASTAFSSIGVLDIGQIVVPVTRVLQSRTDQDSAPAGDSKSTTVSFDESYIFLVEQQLKRQDTTSFVDATQPRKDPIPTSPPNAKSSRREKFIVLATSETGPLENARRDALPVECTAEAPFKDWILLDWARNARLAASKHSSFSVFLQSAMIPARYHAHAFPTMDEARTIR